MADLHGERIDYTGDLLPTDLAGFDPWAQFDAWFEQARAEQAAGRLAEPNAMILSTVEQTSIGWQPTSRVVLLKEYSPDGMVFFTNYSSAKGRQIDEDPLVSLLFWWPSLMRQIRVEGFVDRLSRERSEAYFAERPRASQLGAWASEQSQPVPSREQLVATEAALEQRFADQPVPCPPHWGGYSVRANRFEFWQGQPGRLHERVQVSWADQTWQGVRLQP